MNLEDDLRDAMRAHDVDAPSVSGLGPLPWRRPPRRPGWILPAAAAAVVLLVAGALLGLRAAAKSSPTTATTKALTCPKAYGQPDKTWVPSLPRGVDVVDRLVPTAIPATATVCHYASPHDEPGGGRKLSGQRTLRAGLAALRDLLTNAAPETRNPLLCLAIGYAGDHDNYLLGLTYAGGSVWLSATGSCTGSSNGRFSSLLGLQSVFKLAGQTGRWPMLSHLPLTAMCTFSGGHNGVVRFLPSGRLGQDKTMVPAGALTAHICTNGPTGTKPRTERRSIGDPTTLSNLEAVLNSLSTRPSTNGCAPTATKTQDFNLVFSYPSGPDVTVSVDAGCDPEIDNMSLQASDDGTVVKLLRSLLR
jgi:hypothetical protein